MFEGGELTTSIPESQGGFINYLLYFEQLVEVYTMFSCIFLMKVKF